MHAADGGSGNCWGGRVTLGNIWREILSAIWRNVVSISEEGST
jgi:hypothetical protein